MLRPTIVGVLQHAASSRLARQEAVLQMRVIR